MNRVNQTVGAFAPTPAASPPDTRQYAGSGNGTLIAALPAARRCVTRWLETVPAAPYFCSSFYELKELGSSTAACLCPGSDPPPRASNASPSLLSNATAALRSGPSRHFASMRGSSPRATCFYLLQCCDNLHLGMLAPAHRHLSQNTKSCLVLCGLRGARHLVKNF
jgi:hypothetical protein